MRSRPRTARKYTAVGVTLASGFNPLDATSVIAATGLIGIFCVLVAETGLLVGFFLPGDSLLFSAGLLAASHGALHLPLASVLAVAAAGALIGAQTRIHHRSDRAVYDCWSGPNGRPCAMAWTGCRR